MLDARRPDDHAESIAPDLEIAEPEVCPYLGLPDDPRTRFAFADPAHRCHVEAKPIPIGLGYQGAYCLTTGYPACKRFRPPRIAVTMVSRDGGTSGGRNRASRRGAALLAILALGLLIGALWVGASGGFTAGGGGRLVAASPSTGATPAGTTASADTPTPPPTQSPSSSARSSATPAATRKPSPTSIIHVVVRGETLTSIAARYGVTAKAIQDANKIVDQNVIQTGDRLVIPPPP